MAKKQEQEVNYELEIHKLLHQMSFKYDRYKVFDDFLSLAICSFHSINIQTKLREKDAENEEIYERIIKAYQESDRNTFSKILGLLMVYINENNYSDILGEYFELSGFYNEKLGQFFTPEPICDFMAYSLVGEGTEGKRILDPAAGSGRMLLSTAKIAPKNIFFACDISNTLAKLCTLNFFINGLRGEVCWGDTLRMKYHQVWQINMNGVGILPISPVDSIGFNDVIIHQETSPKIVKKAPPAFEKEKPNLSNIEQLKLF